MPTEWRQGKSVDMERIDSHGIDCPCDECEKIRDLIKGKVLSGELYLSGLPKDKNKIMK